MLEKYRVHEVAKDLGLPSKAVVDLLAEYFPDSPKKHMTALDETELSVIFERYTAGNSVESFDPIFAAAREKREVLAAEAAVKAAETAKLKAEADAKAKAEAAVKAKAAAEAKAKADAEAAAKARTQPAGRPEVRRAPQEQRRPEPNRARAPMQPAPQKAAPQKAAPQKAAPQPVSRVEKFQQTRQQTQQVQQQSQQRQQKPQKPAQPRPQHQTIHLQGAAPAQPAVAVTSESAEPSRVDMRTVKVNLDKYNERYEQIAPTNLAKKDTGVRKQKLNQRSANRKPFMSRKEREEQKLQRMEMERQRRQKLDITLPEEIAVSDLASRLKIQTTEVVKILMKVGVMASAGQIIDYDTAAMVAIEIGAKVSPEVIVTIEDRLFEEVADTAENLKKRCPVVVVMGHVDHGKTSLLDAIRNTSVTSVEAGGITQHIGAYQVDVGESKITFLDTPGHAAFTSMRARGAQVTDIAILVVAADDGVMPQTVEAINHAKAAGVPIIVAINKMDKPAANASRVMQELTEHELVAEEWGGETICVPVSAHTGEGLDTLLEMVQITAEVRELTANPDRLAKGTVIEARLDRGRGPVATILVQNGTLRSGDVVIAGTSLGRVRVMTDDKGRRIEEAGPSTPVEIMGLSEVPQAGDLFNAVEDERLARELAEQRRHEAKEEQWGTYQKVTLDNLFSQISEGNVKELAIVVKADVQGSVEAVRQSLEKIANEEVRVRVIHGGVGAVNESDVMLANASNAIIVGFNVRPDPLASEMAEKDGVDVRLYRVIYDAIDEIKDAMKGMLAPKFREVELGRAEVRTVFKISSAGTIAGCYVRDGKILRSAHIRVVRDGIIIADDMLDSLRRFKDDVREVAQGYECGMGLTKFNDIKEGDIFEAYNIEEYRD